MRAGCRKTWFPCFDFRPLRALTRTASAYHADIEVDIDPVTAIAHTRPVPAENP